MTNTLNQPVPAWHTLGCRHFNLDAHQDMFKLTGESTNISLHTTLDVIRYPQLCWPTHSPACNFIELLNRHRVSLDQLMGMMTFHHHSRGSVESSSFLWNRQTTGRPSGLALKALKLSLFFHALSYCKFGPTPRSQINHWFT